MSPRVQIVEPWFAWCVIGIAFIGSVTALLTREPFWPGMFWRLVSLWMAAGFLQLWRRAENKHG